MTVNNVLRFLIILLVSCHCISAGFAQKPAVQWQRTLGGSSDDNLFDLILTADGGYIATGRTSSGISGNKTDAAKGGTDIWIVKLDAQGATEWQRSIGTNVNDHAANVIQTTDGGYALGGFSTGGINGDRTTPAKGYVDYWILKLTATGTISWQKTYGGVGVSGANQAYSFIQTPDNGFLLSGMSSGLKGPPGDKSEDPRLDPLDLKDDFDYWTIKTDASGNLQWDRTMGGEAFDQAHSSTLTNDGGYLVGGWSRSKAFGDKTEPYIGGEDAWIYKLNAAGVPQWQKTLGGTADEYTSGMLQQTTDGGFMAGITSASGVSGNKTATPRGGEDFWLVKLDASGSIIWQKAIGGSGNDHIENGYQTADNGFMLAGHSSSGISGDKTEASQGNDDLWLVKVDETGNIISQWVYGGDRDDILQVVHPTGDGGYILGGSSYSGVSGDKTEKNFGGADWWIVKLGPRKHTPGSTNCQGGENKAWIIPASDDFNNYTYTWYDATNKLLQVVSGNKGDTLFNLVPGKYAVRVKNAFGVDDLFPIEIKPEAYDASFKTTIICKNDSFRVSTATKNFISYLWDFGNGFTSSKPEPSYAYSEEKPFTITVVATTANGCIGKGSADIVVNSIPSIVAQNYVTAECATKPISFTCGYSEPIASYYWDFGDGTYSVIGNPLKAYASAVESPYNIKHRVISSKGCISDTAFNTVTIHTLPVVNAGKDLIVVSGESETIEGTVNDPLDAVKWTPATYLSNDDVARPVVTPVVDMLYYLTATNEHGCRAVDSVQVNVLIQLRVPNAFSPNNDGINDTWIIPGLSNYAKSVVSVFNRWGQLVYQSNGYSRPWDGKHNGQSLILGTYYYIIDLKNNQPKIQGSVTIIR